MAKIFLSALACILYILCDIYAIEAAQRKGTSSKVGGSRSYQYPTSTQVDISKDWYKCDFESGYCGWRNDTAAEFQWYRTSQPTPTTETGPRWDHTKAGVKGAGHYLYIETSVPQKNGDRARLISPTLQETGLFCFRFWHNMHGSDIKDLNIKFKGQKSRKERTLLHLSGPWSVGINSGMTKDEDVDWWNQEFVEVLVMEPINFVIEGLAGKNYKGDIAIDDINLEKGNCPRLSGNCDFENNTCGWTQMADDQFNWLPNRGKTQTSKTGPSNDHTLGTSHGRYLYIEASWPRVEGDKARLLSPKILCDNGASPVFNFWYHMYGVHSGPLKIYVTNDKEMLGNAHWEKTGNQGDQWFLGQVVISTSILSKGSFYVIIEAERENFEGDVAIDDLGIVGCRSDEVGFGNLQLLTTTSQTTTAASGRHEVYVRSTNSPAATLPDNINCDFEEEEFCGWNQFADDNADWIRIKNRTPSSQTGPAGDHTSGDGWYIYFEASTPRKPGDVAVLRSRSINPLIQACVTFYYHMRGKTMGSLEVLTATSEDASTQYKRKWMKQGQQSRNVTDWKYAEVTITESEPYQVLFRATRGGGFNSDVALDDIKVYPKPCSSEHAVDDSRQSTAGPAAQARHKIACDLDKDSTCLWKQLSPPNDDFDWTIASTKKSVSKDTGPSGDHTSGSRQNFIFIDASLKNFGDRAKLISPSFNIDTPKCFRFWYHMLGAGIGNLTFYKMVGNKFIPLWKNGGDKGNSWFEGMIDLAVSRKTILVVEASRGSSAAGDIALDDFDLTDGECPSVDCDFETNNCGWVQDGQNDQFNWTRHQGPTRSMHTGPSYDHTLQDATGTYLYIEASDRQRFDKAWIRSPIIDPQLSAEKCLTFWYHSFGENVGSLSVNKIQPNGNALYHESNLWIDEKNHGDQWVYGTVTIKDTLPYQLVIQGVIGLDYLGDIAIDDIHLTDGACDPCCDESKFRCGNHFCIHKSQRCNGIDECGDESDESFCVTASQPECGMPFDTPAVVDALETSNDVHRDEAIFETFVIPMEDSDFTSNYTEATWKGAFKIPYAQASALKHIRFVENPSSSTKSETIEVARKKRSVDDADDEDSWIDILKFQESYKILKMTKKQSATPTQSLYAKLRENIKNQFGGDHEISRSDWKMMKGKIPTSTKSNRVKRSNKKVIGGIRTSRLNYPWQVAYYITDSSSGSHFFCGGTLIDRYWVLTAAHCPYLGDIHNIVLGDYDLFTEEGVEQEKLVDAIFIRNLFKLNETLGDVALIKLRYPAKQTKSVQLACLLSDDQAPFKEGQLCVTTGWGKRSTSPRIERYLRQAQMPIVQPSLCASEFGLPLAQNDSYICAGGNGANTCKGDSGGPLVCKKDDGRFYLAGITVWQGTRCSASTPGVFTRVQSFNSWIRRIVKKYSGCKPH